MPKTWGTVLVSVVLSERLLEATSKADLLDRA